MSTAESCFFLSCVEYSSGYMLHICQELPQKMEIYTQYKSGQLKAELLWSDRPVSHRVRSDVRGRRNGVWCGSGGRREGNSVVEEGMRKCAVCVCVRACVCACV